MDLDYFFVGFIDLWFHYSMYGTVVLGFV